MTKVKTKIKRCSRCEYPVENETKTYCAWCEQAISLGFDEPPRYKNVPKVIKDTNSTESYYKINKNIQSSIEDIDFTEALLYTNNNYRKQLMPRKSRIKYFYSRKENQES